MTLRDINRRIRQKAPHVELVRGKGYHYFVYDNGIEYDSFMVMVPYLYMLLASRWIADAIDFSVTTEKTIAERKERGYRGGPFACFAAPAQP